MQIIWYKLKGYCTLLPEYLKKITYPLNFGESLRYSIKLLFTY